MDSFLGEYLSLPTGPQGSLAQINLTGQHQVKFVQILQKTGKNQKFIVVALKQYVSTALNRYSGFILGWKPFITNRCSWQLGINRRIGLALDQIGPNRTENSPKTSIWGQPSTLGIYCGRRGKNKTPMIYINNSTRFISGQIKLHLCIRSATTPKLLFLDLFVMYYCLYIMIITQLFII